MRRSVELSGIRSLPVVVTVPVRSQIRACHDVIKGGRKPLRPVILARCEGSLYAVDGLDTLEACRAAGLKKASCMVTDARDIPEAVLLHVGLCRRLPVNPFLVVDAVGWASERGAECAGLEPQFARLARLPLHGDVRKIFDKWILRLAERLDTLPPFWHIFGPLSEIRADEQSRALNSVMAFVHATGTSPDASSLRAILNQFAPKRGTTDHVAGIEGEGKMMPPAKPAQNGADTLPDTSRVSCECGRQWYVDTKNSSVRRVEDSENMVVLTDSGEPVYAMPQTVAEHLDVGGSPVHHYVIPGMLPAVLVSKKPLDGRVIGRVSCALNSPEQDHADSDTDVCQ